MEAGVEPTEGEADVAVDSGFRGVQDGGGFFGGKAEEEAEFDGADAGFVEDFEFVEGRFEVERGWVGVIADPGEFVIEGEVEEVAAAFFGFCGSGVIDEDASHDTGGQGVEVVAIVYFEAVGVEEFDEEFVDEFGGLEGMGGVAALDIGAGEVAEVVIDERSQIVESAAIALAPTNELLCDVPRSHRTRSLA